MLRCAIVEDSPRELEHLKECLARYSAERDIPLETTAFGDAASFLEHYRADYDIVFMDIELPGTGTLQDADQRLHGKGFLRCNKCYLVNQKHIQTVTGSDVVLSNGEKLQISRLRKKEFMEELARSMGNEFVL